MYIYYIYSYMSMDRVYEPNIQREISTSNWIIQVCFAYYKGDRISVAAERHDRRQM